MAKQGEQMNPMIQVRHRHTLADSSGEEKLRELDRVRGRIASKRIDFGDLSAELSPEMEEVVKNIGEVAAEYPELQLVVEGHTSKPEAFRRRAEADQLSISRAERVVSCLTSVALNDIRAEAKGAGADLATGYCSIRLMEGELLQPQQRIDMVLKHFGFDFKPRSLDLSAKGLQISRSLALILMEAQTPATLWCPRSSSELAMSRAHTIAQAIRTAGFTYSLEVRKSSNDLHGRATLMIDGQGVKRYEALQEQHAHASGSPFDEEFQGHMPVEDAPLVWDPQSRLADILRETPLAFTAYGSDLVPEVMPAIRRIAAVLKEVRDSVCMVEAFSGQRSLGDQAQRLMQDRADRIVDHLRAEGVTLQCKSRGYCGGYAAMGSRCPGPCIVLTLVKPGEDIDAIDDEGLGMFGCLDIGGPKAFGACSK